jgi:hypothetical protein
MFKVMSAVKGVVNEEEFEAILRKIQEQNQEILDA